VVRLRTKTTNRDEAVQMSNDMERRSTSTKVYVGNLSWNTTEEGLRRAMEQGGRTVNSVVIKTDARSGRSRGFGFVDLGSEDEAQAVITTLDGTELDGRPIKVSSAREQKSRSGGFGRGDGDRGGSGGGRGGRGGRW
jgi:RNA recognition motif-containing protein